MRNKIFSKSALSLMMSLILSFSLLINCKVAYAKTSTASTKGNIKIVQDDGDTCRVVDEYKGDKLYVTLDKKTNEITMKSIEKSKNVICAALDINTKEKNYKVKVNDLNNPYKKGEVSATIVDNDSKKEYKIDNNKVKAQAPAVIPLLDILGAEILEYLGEMGYLMIISGATASLASAIMADLTQKNDRYYTADFEFITYGPIYVGPAISYAEALSRMQSGKNIMCKYASDAKNVAGRVYLDSTKFPPVGPEIDAGKENNPGYFYHYHPYGRNPNSHAWIMRVL